MPTSIGHGKIVCRDDHENRDEASDEFVWVPRTSAAHGLTPGEEKLVRGSAPISSFDYFFDGDGLPEDTEAFARLGDVGAKMLTDSGLIGPRGLPAILTYFGQFVDHDITLNTDADPSNHREFAVAPPDGKLTRNARDEVRRVIVNGRIASLRLDSLYGDDTDVEDVLRDGAKMRIGTTTSGQPNDLPRLAQLDTDHPLRQMSGATPSTPLVGDARNDENLIVAQLHLAFLRFHNAIVDALPTDMGEDKKFSEAKRLTILHYQWLVLEQYLPEICNREMLDRAVKEPAVFYQSFSNGTGKMPLEFSVAAFRFGHSMIRPQYRFNDSFQNATLDDIFTFTGSGGGIQASGLPQIWVIDWANFLPDDDEERAARGVDSKLAEDLGKLFERNPMLRSLPARNLRRSYVLSIPTAQQVLRALGGHGPAPLTQDELRGFGDGVLEQHGYTEATPLWIYILLEAELREGARRLGPLGSLIVAQTLVGLMAEDPNSVLNSRPGKGMPWHPSQEPIGGTVIDSFDAMLRFAGVL